MSQAGGERKSEPIKIRVRPELLERVHQAQDTTSARNLDRQQFLAMLVDMGLDAWEKREKSEHAKNDLGKQTPGENSA